MDYIFMMILAGTPPTTTFGGTYFVTTAPAAMTALLPTVTLGCDGGVCSHPHSFAQTDW